MQPWCNYPREHHWWPVKLRYAIRQLHKAGHSNRAIARWLRLNKDAVGKFLRTGEYPGLKRSLRESAWPEKLRKQIRKMHAKGDAITVIAGKLGLSCCAVWRYLKTGEYPGSKWRRRRPQNQPAPSRDEIQRACEEIQEDWTPARRKRSNRQ